MIRALLFVGPLRHCLTIFHYLSRWHDRKRMAPYNDFLMKEVKPCLPDLQPAFEHVALALQSNLPFPSTLKEILPLAGDASNRRYYRLHLADGMVSSLILMQLADPEGFKASEEAVSGAANEITELPFVNVLTHLSQINISVPSLHYYDEQPGLLYLEDFGDVTLAQACLENKVSDLEHLYSKAIDLLVQIHLRGTFPKNPSCLAFHREFDVSLLLWEFDHFLEYGIEARQGRLMSAEDKKAVETEFRKIAELLSGQPHVFTHRDYHSRNLMVDGDRLGVIDFQDALMGPATYDLASLLKDSYVELDGNLVDRLIDRYIEGMCAGLDSSTQQAMLLTDRSAFRRLFDLTSIQRNLKAAGRFVYIDQVKQNPKFLSDIPRTLGYVWHNLQKYPELHTLRTHLMPYIPEWQ